MADCDCIEQLAFLVQKHGLGNILLPLIKHAVGQEFDLCSCAVCWPNQWSLKSASEPKRLRSLNSHNRPSRAARLPSPGPTTTSLRSPPHYKA